MSSPEFRILLIEDNSADALLTKESFEEACPDVKEIVVVSNGQEALSFLRKEGKHENARRPHLILLDLNLPRLNGKQVLAEIKKDPNLRSIPVLVLTVSNSEDDIRAVYDLQASAYIQKPENYDQCLELAQAINNFWFNTASLIND